VQKSNSHYAPQPYTNQSVFKSLLNCTSEISLSRNATRREFQRHGPATEKLLSPRRIRVLFVAHVKTSADRSMKHVPQEGQIQGPVGTLVIFSDLAQVSAKKVGKWNQNPKMTQKLLWCIWIYWHSKTMRVPTCGLKRWYNCEHVHILYGSGQQFIVFFGNTLGLPEIGDVLVCQVAKLGTKLVELCQLVLQGSRYLLPNHIEHLRQYQQTTVYSHVPVRKCWASFCPQCWNPFIQGSASPSMPTAEEINTALKLSAVTGGVRIFRI